MEDIPCPTPRMVPFRPVTDSFFLSHTIGPGERSSGEPSRGGRSRNGLHSVLVKTGPNDRGIPRWPHGLP